MNMRFLVVMSAILALGGAGYGASLADAGAGDLPPNWHVHDGQLSLGPQHKGIGFFPQILGVSPAEYVEDPARCPDATDKAFLPQGREDEQPLRAGVCMTSSAIIHLHTVPIGTEGPAGWSSLTVASEPGWVTYYLVSSR
jgi:hypothetical protein